MRPAAPRRAVLALAAVCAFAAPLAGCSGADENRSGPSPSPRTSSDTEICIALVGYWAKEVFLERPTSGRDFMQKGLSNGQNEILLAAVEAAQKERERSDSDAALKILDRRVEEGCEKRYRDGKPTEGIWRDPSASATDDASPADGAGAATPGTAVPTTPEPTSPSP
ncbi:hypothetical protein [Streptomyces indicus]|uniref:Lipoprotein n=1 Tax=Streptomyces indicus TaxID=417292 RepID=A0A1G8Z5C1_9ACTN|nr:hypothetical protein [Streptomyces indicus]SDK10292.1 hypothetical protein SAMN05421806_104450 [Streptomyces indicus]